MSLQKSGVINIPDAEGSSFDHGAFDPKTRRVFVAHTARDRLEVIDHDLGSHLRTIDGFPEAAGVVVDAGHVLVTNRRSAQLAWLDACTVETRGIFDTGTRPNGVAIVSRLHLAVVACIGDGHHGPELQVFNLSREQRWAVSLPGPPRWCVTDQLIQSIDPRTGISTEVSTAIDAKTTALAFPDTLYVFSAAHGGALVLTDS